MASSLNERFITSLNNDIFITIFEHMDVEDLKNICLVNSRFYELVTNTSSVNKKFGLDIDSNYNATIIEALMKSNRHFEHMSIPSSKHDSDKPMTCKSSQIIDLIKNVGGRVKNMEFMQFEDQKIIVCPNPIFELLQTMPNIESLMFYSNNISSECVESLPTTTILKFTQLKEVHAPFAMILPILKHVNTLEKLIVFECNEYDLDYSNCMEFIEVLRKNQSTLKSFKFNAIKEFFDHDIQVLFKILFYFLNNITKPFLGFVHLESV